MTMEAPNLPEPVALAARRAVVTDGLRRSAAILSAAAGVIHIAVVPEHLRESGLFAAFFIVSGIGQIALAVYLWFRARGWAFVGIVLANVGVVALWIVSRTAGLPLGPDPGVPEAIGLPDVAATVFEALLVVALLAAVRIQSVRRAVAAVGARLVPFTMGATLAVTSFALADVVSGGRHQHHGQAISAFDLGALPVQLTRNGQLIDVTGGSFVVSFPSFPPVGQTVVTFREPPSGAAVPKTLSYDMAFPMGAFTGALTSVSDREQRANVFFGMLGLWRMTIGGEAAGKPFHVVLEFRVRPGNR